MHNKTMLMVQEEHFLRDSDGVIYATRVLSDELLLRYTKYFKKVIIFARIQDISVVNTENKKKITNTSIEFCGIPDFRGPKEFLKYFLRIRKKFRQACRKADLVYFRAPSLLSLALYRYVPKTKKTGMEFMMGADYLIEKEGIPFTWFNYLIDREAKRLARSVNGSLYVTENALQKEYPPYSARNQEKEDNYFSVGISDVELTEAFYKVKPALEAKKASFSLLSVGFMDSNRKGQGIIIQAASLLRKQGYPVEVYLVGEGPMLHHFKKVAQQEGIENFVHFIGKLTSKEAMTQIMQIADVFVLPSRLEGLPRVLIECMASSVPVVASNVNGIPELVQADLLVEDFDPATYALKIQNLYDNPTFYDSVSKRNYQVSQKFKPENLEAPRDSFYKRLAQF